MLVKIVGIQNMNFTLDNGYHFEGRKFHCIDMEKKPDGLVGQVVTNFRIPSSDLRFSVLDVQLGDVWNVYFEQDGKTVGAFVKEAIGAKEGK